jgi:NADH-quinone oxidoreductase subunit F
VEPVLLSRVGKQDSRSIETYIADGGYTALRTVLTGGWTPEKVTEEVKKSGLRGRGGAGFPCGVKWGFVPKDTKGKPVYLLCNADESEPGTFKDRLLIEQDPHQVIEGMILAAYALKCRTAYIYIRGEFYLGARVLDEALAEAYAKGYLGANILGSGYALDIIVHRGAGAYICGEETGLIESLEGKRGQPRIKPPFPAVSGVFSCPTIVNNVETLACVVHIVNRGADWFAKIGREKNTGPKLYCLSGAVNRPGVYEAPMGLPLKDLIFGEDYGRGMKGGRKVKAVIPGGASAAMLTAAEAEDCPLDFDSLAAKGSMLGSAAIIVMNEDTCIVNAAQNIAKFFAHESCGQCTPCREGTPWLHKVLSRIESGQGRSEDIDLLVRISNQMANGMTICVFADAAIAPVLSTVAKFRDEYLYHVAHKRCLVGAGASELVTA